MAIKIVQGQPEKLYKEVIKIVDECFEGIWSAQDLKQLIELPHENKLFMVAYDNEKPIGYAFLVADYIETLDVKIATIQEIGLLPSYRNSEVAGNFLENAIQFANTNKAELLEQVVSTVDQWLIPTLLKKNLKPSEIKADREISSFNEAKVIIKSIRKNPKLNVIMNQLFFESGNELEAQIIENEDDFNELPRKDPIAFGSVISIEKTEDLDKILKELKKTSIEWDEIGITFDYLLE